MIIVDIDFSPEKNWKIGTYAWINGKVTNILNFALVKTTVESLGGIRIRQKGLDLTPQPCCTGIGTVPFLFKSLVSYNTVSVNFSDKHGEECPSVYKRRGWWREKIPSLQFCTGSILQKRLPTFEVPVPTYHPKLYIRNPSLL